MQCSRDLPSAGAGGPAVHTAAQGGEGGKDIVEVTPTTVLRAERRIRKKVKFKDRDLGTVRTRLNLGKERCARLRREKTS